MLTIESLDAPQLRRFTLAEFDEMVRLGIIREEEHVELLAGMVVRMSPQGALHAHVTATLAELLARGLGNRAQVRSHSPLALADSKPEPDVAVVARSRYVSKHPATAFLVVEVADSSLETDSSIKSAIYAAAGIPEYWLVDVQHDRIEICREPRGSTYQTRITVSHGQSLRPAAFPDIEIAVDDILTVV